MIVINGLSEEEEGIEITITEIIEIIGGHFSNMMKTIKFKNSNKLKHKNHEENYNKTTP